jgi:hypothetical protein
MNMSLRASALGIAAIAATVFGGGGVAFADGSSAEAPASPMSLSAVRACFGETSTCSLVVRWQAPKDDGGTPVTSYTVTGEPSGASVTEPGNTYSVRFSYDDPEFTDTSVSVVASNANGASPAAPVTVVTAPGSAGGRLPFTFSAKAKNDGAKKDQLTFRFDNLSRSRLNVRINGHRHVLQVKKGRGTVTLADRNGTKPTTYKVVAKGVTRQVTAR